MPTSPISAERAPAELLCSGEIRLLVIDDDPATCQVIEAALSREDFLIRSVSDPNLVEAVLRADCAAGPPFHVILLDYVLPGLDPEAVLSWIRDFQAEAAVIVVTGYPTMEGALTCLRARTVDYLTKPFALDHLRQTVMRCLQARGLLRISGERLIEAVGATLRERRKSLGFTLTEIARRAGISVGFLSQIELGKASASVETLYRLCLALKFRMSELFEAVQRGM